MGEAKQRDHQVIFAMGSIDSGPLVMLGIPEGAWDYMRGGKTHTFDLTRVGFPVSIVMFGGPSRAHIMDALGVFKPGQTGLVDLATDYAIPESEKAAVKMREAARAYLQENVPFEWSDTWPGDAFLDGLVSVILSQGEEPHKQADPGAPLAPSGDSSA